MTAIIAGGIALAVFGFVQIEHLLLVFLVGGAGKIINGIK